MQVEISELSLTGYSVSPSTAQVEVAAYNHTERWTRAIKALGLSWLVALGVAFIPVAHLVLVPGFVLLGILLFVRRFRTHREVLAAVGTCPNCGHEQKLEVSGSSEPPVSVTCVNCRRTLRLVATPETRDQP